MKRTTVTFFAIITLSLLLTVYIIEITKPKTQTTLQPTPQHQQAQTFLSDVVGLDLTKYDLTLLPTKKIPKLEYDENNQKYQIESTSNQFNAYVEYENNLTRCRLRWIEEATQLAQYSTDPLKIAKDFIVKYKEFSQKTYLTEIEQMLNQVTKTEPTTVVSESGRIILKIIQRDRYLYFQWENTVNGLHNNYNKISIILRDNYFSSFLDSWESHVISDAEITVSRSLAISMVKNLAKNYRYMFDGKFIGNLTMVDDPYHVELSMSQRKDFVIYPLWHIRFGLTEIYPGTVTEIRASIWADTGEVAYINAAGPLSPPSFEE